MSAAIERESRSGMAPERLDTAIERDRNIPFTAEKNNLFCRCANPCPST